MKWAIILIIAYFALGKYFLYSLCPMVVITGFPRPGCGLTRARFRLLRLDFAGAWRMHPLVFAAAGFLLFAAWMWVTGQGNPLRKKWLLRTFAALFACREQFGKAYLQYMKRVRRYL